MTSTPFAREYNEYKGPLLASPHSTHTPLSTPTWPALSLQSGVPALSSALYNRYTGVLISTGVNVLPRRKTDYLTVTPECSLAQGERVIEKEDRVPEPAATPRGFSYCACTLSVPLTPFGHKAFVSSGPSLWSQGIRVVRPRSQGTRVVRPFLWSQGIRVVRPFPLVTGIRVTGHQPNSVRTVHQQLPNYTEGRPQYNQI